MMVNRRIPLTNSQVSDWISPNTFSRPAPAVWYSGLFSTGLIGYWDAGLTESAPTGSNGTTWKGISGTMGDINIQGLSTNWTYGGSGLGGYIQNSTTSSGANSGMAVSLSGFTRTKGTFEAWVYSSSWNASNGLFMNQPTDTANDGNWFWIGAWNSGEHMYVRSGSAPNAPSDCCSNDLNITTSTINTNTRLDSFMPTASWRHIVVVWDHSLALGSSYTQVFINNTLRYQRVGMTYNTQNVNPSGATIGRIGAGHNTTNSQFLGRIGYIRMYNTTLSAANISQNYNYSSSRYV